MVLKHANKLKLKINKNKQTCPADLNLNKPEITVGVILYIFMTPGA